MRSAERPKLAGLSRHRLCSGQDAHPGTRTDLVKRSDRMAAVARAHPGPFRWALTTSRLGVRSGLLPFALYGHWMSRRLASEVGMPFFHPQWVRVVMYRECAAWLRALRPETLDLLEISPEAPDADPFMHLGFRSVERVGYPDFDVCRDRLERSFDVIVADQVFEHLLWPYRAGRNVHAMLRPGGYFLVTTPFLIRVHDYPVDCSRWTELGLKHFLAECGFPFEGVRTASWGNRAAVKANFSRWASWRWWRSLRNEPSFPVSVWALARKDGS
jgi:hypothetical protein